MLETGRTVEYFERTLHNEIELFSAWMDLDVLCFVRFNTQLLQHILRNNDIVEVLSLFGVVLCLPFNCETQHKQTVFLSVGDEEDRLSPEFILEN